MSRCLVCVQGELPVDLTHMGARRCGEGSGAQPLGSSFSSRFQTPGLAFTGGTHRCLPSPAYSAHEAHPEAAHRPRRGGERPTCGPHRAREIIRSGPAEATAGETQNSIRLGAFFIANF